VPSQCLTKYMRQLPRMQCQENHDSFVDNVQGPINADNLEYLSTI